MLFLQIAFLLLLASIQLALGSPNQNRDEKDGAQLSQQYCVSNIENDPQILLEQSLDAKDWALSNGLVKLMNSCNECYYKKGKVNIVTQFLPFALYPSPFPRSLFQQAVDVHQAMLLLYFRISSDYAFLKDAHRQVVNSERKSIIQSLIKRLDNLYNDGFQQPVAMFCQRADYMASEDDNGQIVLKQVEVNTGAIGGIATSARFSQLHRRMVANAGLDASEAVTPLNQSDKMYAETLYHSWQQFGNNEAVILFVHGNPNSHLMLESRQIVHKLEEITSKKVKSRFITLKEAFSRLKIDPIDKSLIFDDKYVVAVLVDRIGREISDAELAVCVEFERSTAIKSRPMSFFVSHTKRMQQVLSTPGIVERFFTGPGEEGMAKAIRKVQIKGWPIGADENIEEGIRQKAMENPQDYVLKANDCGPTGMSFNEDMVKKLQSMAPAERDFYYLTEKLRPTTVKNHFVRPNAETMLNVNANPELGIFGCLVGNMNTGQVSFFSRIGHMMKSKMDNVDEGGVWRGNSVYDSPYLV
ncbi:hypothetical protein niasHS_006998 [Heterodera schachtii]|uniref:Glutathione synthetase n=1 Tax=Heterodera schachtii TaxID=97005 RepID=A0ABD2JF87_HETSC